MKHFWITARRTIAQVLILTAILLNIAIWISPVAYLIVGTGGLIVSSIVEAVQAYNRKQARK